MDALGHVNNVRYLDYAQEARIAFFTELLGPMGRSPLIVGRQEIDYLHPLVYRNHPLVVVVMVQAVGCRSFTLRQTIREPEATGEAYAKVVTVMVGFEPAAGRSRPLRPEETEVLTALLNR